MSIPCHTNKLPEVSRVVTTHNGEGKSIISDSVPDLSWTSIPDANFGLAYVTKSFPTDLNDDVDIQNYNELLKSPPGLKASGGTVVRYVDMKPASTSPLHRTISLDYGFVVEGEVELVLDSGEVARLKRGDSVVQRGTNHAWRNPHPTEWSRMIFVLVDAMPMEVAGRKLEEAKVDGVRASD